MLLSCKDKRVVTLLSSWDHARMIASAYSISKHAELDDNICSSSVQPKLPPSMLIDEIRKFQQDALVTRIETNKEIINACHNENRVVLAVESFIKKLVV